MKSKIERMPSPEGETARARATRPELERTEPIRSFKTLFGPASRAKTGRKRAAATTNGAPAADPIRRSVDIGYQVIDEYIRQGQSIAEAVRGGTAAPEWASHELPRLTERMFQYAQDFASIWLDAMGLMMSASGRGANGAWSGTNGHEQASRDGDGDAPPHWHGSPAAPDSSGVASPLAVHVVTTRPVEVSLSWLPGSAAGPFIVHDLRSAEKDKPRIRDARIEKTADGTLAVRIRVAKGQAAGEYRGAIVEVGSSLPRGTLTLLILK